ncbi:exodeoxyribonuclease VII small subunit [Candidatus Poribacteria bacterium]|nr:exodeoxyribonuclease VII small subunit [Candidatus Poribacteria bacterium]
MTFEEKLDRLKKIVEELESPETMALDTSLELFEEGVGIVRSCKELLEQAELRIQNVTEEESEEDDSEPAQDIENGE